MKDGAIREGQTWRHETKGDFEIGSREDGYHVLLGGRHEWHIDDNYLRAHFTLVSDSAHGKPADADPMNAAAFNLDAPRVSAEEDIAGLRRALDCGLTIGERTTDGAWVAWICRNKPKSGIGSANSVECAACKLARKDVALVSLQKSVREWAAQTNAEISKIEARDAEIARLTSDRERYRKAAHTWEAIASERETALSRSATMREESRQERDALVAAGLALREAWHRNDGDAGKAAATVLLALLPAKAPARKRLHVCPVCIDDDRRACGVCSAQPGTVAT